MKVLVYFEQEFFSEPTENNISFKMRDNIAHVFEAENPEDLFRQFAAWDFVPFYIRQMSNNKKIYSGYKFMHWYLPENRKPYF